MAFMNIISCSCREKNGHEMFVKVGKLKQFLFFIIILLHKTICYTASQEGTPFITTCNGSDAAPLFFDVSNVWQINSFTVCFTFYPNAINKQGLIIHVPRPLCRMGQRKILSLSKFREEANLKKLYRIQIITLCLHNINLTKATSKQLQLFNVQ